MRQKKLFSSSRYDASRNANSAGQSLYICYGYGYPLGVDAQRILTKRKGGCLGEMRYFGRKILRGRRSLGDSD